MNMPHEFQQWRPGQYGYVSPDFRRWPDAMEPADTWTVCPDCGGDVHPDGICFWCENEPSRPVTVRRGRPGGAAIALLFVLAAVGLVVMRARRGR